MGQFLGLFLLILSNLCLADARLVVQGFDEDNKLRGQALRESLRQEIEQGIWDPYEVRFPQFGSDTFLEVNSKHFPKYEPDIQFAIINKLEAYYDNWHHLPAFRAEVIVDSLVPTLGIFDRLGIQLKELPRLPAHHLLSNYAKNWAYQKSEMIGPNCFHTSIASVNPKWKEHRFMSDKEFDCHLTESFEKIDALEEYGDLIRIFDDKGRSVHGYTYLGGNEKKPEQKIVFTKNGVGKGYYLFMKYEDVLNIYRKYGGANVEFYRAKEVALDPKATDQSGCYGINFSDRIELDAITVKRLKENPPENSQPL